MRLRAVAVMAVVTGLSMVAWAGDIEGKVAGMKGKSVVYVDTIAGKTFPAPADHPVIDQKGLTFAPSRRGATGDYCRFQERRQRGPQCLLAQRRR